MGNYKRLIIAVAVVGIIAFIYITPSLGIALTDEFPFFTIGPQITHAMTQDVLTTTEARVPVVMFLSPGPMKERPSMAIYGQAERQVMAISVRLMTVYNFEPYRYSPLFGIVAGWLPREKIQQVYADPNVISIDYDRLITVPKLQSMPGIRYLSLEEVIALDNIGVMWGKGWRGEGVKIAYIDSGAPSSVAIEALSVDNVSPIDFYGHGSMVYDVISKLAPSAHIVSIKVLDEFGNGRLSSVIRGIEVAVMNGVHVVNMSLGAPAGLWDSLSEAASLASEYYGVKIFAASGNVGEQGTLSPARSSQVVSVGAIDENLEVTPYSSRGKVDTVGFGDIRAMWLGQIADESGTSCASPQAAAMYACWLSGHPEAVQKNVDQIALVGEASLDLPPAGPDRYTGWGLLSGQVLAETEPIYAPSLWEKLALPFILLAAVVCIIAGIAIIRIKRGWE